MMRYENWNGLGLRMSKLAFGCAPVMGRVPKRHAIKSMGSAFDCGVTHYDVARSYGFGEAEGVLGEFLKGKRDKVTVATKFGIKASKSSRMLSLVKPIVRPFINKLPFMRTQYLKHSQELLPKGYYGLQDAQVSLDESLRALGTDYVDILFIHDCSPADELSDPLQQWLEELVSKGKIRAWGLATNREWLDPLIERTSISPMVLQCENKGFGSVVLREDGVANIPSIYHSPLGGSKGIELYKELAAKGALSDWWRNAGLGAFTVEKLFRLAFESAIFQAEDNILLCSMFKEEHIMANVDAVNSPQYDEHLYRSFLTKCNQVTMER